MTASADREPVARYRSEIVGSLASVDATEWNRIAGERNPFVRHEFLLRG